MGYQTVSESLQWLRIELRYGKNAPHSDTSKGVLKTDNPQPSSYIRYDKNTEKVQRLNGYGSEKINHLQ